MKEFTESILDAEKTEDDINSVINMDNACKFAKKFLSNEFPKTGPFKDALGNKLHPGDIIMLMDSYGTYHRSYEIRLITKITKENGGTLYYKKYLPEYNGISERFGDTEYSFEVKWLCCFVIKLNK